MSLNQSAPLELDNDDGVRKRQTTISPDEEENEQMDAQQQKHLTAASSANVSTAASASSSDEEDLIRIVREKRLHKLRKVLPQSSDKLGIYIDSLLSKLPERWRNWVVRGILSVWTQTNSAIKFASCFFKSDCYDCLLLLHYQRRRHVAHGIGIFATVEMLFRDNQNWTGRLSAIRFTLVPSSFMVNSLQCNKP